MCCMSTSQNGTSHSDCEGEKRVRGRGGRREIGRNARGNGRMIGKEMC